MPIRLQPLLLALATFALMACAVWALPGASERSCQPMIGAVAGCALPW
jgi:hypothetical protein